MVFVWLTAFFLVVALIVLVIYQVSANPYPCLGTRGILLWPIPREIEAAVVADLHVVSVGLSVV